jgi:ubiquinone/menaquinone biosynthesis C-methylase UbiE
VSATQRQAFAARLSGVFAPQAGELRIQGNYLLLSRVSAASNQSQTNEVFSDKWGKYDNSPDKERLYEMQKRWYLQLYGFETEENLAAFLQARPVIFDAGCGLGYKAAWFAALAPASLIVGMDFSEAALHAAHNYPHLPNLFFVQGDIAATGFRDGSVDYVSCDQVIQHTEDPDRTFSELTRVTSPDGGEFACYFYAKKALPRELLDDYFRTRCLSMSKDEIWQLSEQLTELGKRLSELNATFESPDIPALGIKGGRYDVQRFLYWNFLKCYWNSELGRETSVVTNFDWYSPSNARRYSEAEVRGLIDEHGLSVQHFHSEEACYSGRFRRACRR